MMIGSILSGCVLLGAAALPAEKLAAVVQEKTPAEMSQLKVFGWAGERLNACIRNQMAIKDVAYLAAPFTHKTETGSWGVVEPGIWQTEFWGKYMHAAVPMAEYAADVNWSDKIAASVNTIVKSQLDDGYIGNYTVTNRGDV